MTLAATALTTFEVVREELSLTTSDQRDYLERLINACSEQLAAECRRDLAYSASVTERVRSGRTALLSVRRAPIVSITSITLDDGASATVYPSTDYRIDSAQAGLIERINGFWPETADVTGVNRDPLAHSQRRRISVVYAGGWVTPAQAESDGSLTRNLPYDIEDAVVEMVVARYRKRGRDATVKSRSTLRASITYDTSAVGSSGLTPLARRVVAKYAWRDS